MADFLTTSGISYNIENIILNAKYKLFLVSPYLQISKTLLERLKDASLNGVKITIIYGKDELKYNEKKALENIKNLKLLYFENLHAKCYFNEELMVITSMNMYEFSEKNNREMGILIDKKIDKTIYEKAKTEVDSIITASEKRHSNSTENRYSNNYNINKSFCIRCNSKIPFNPSKPYCSTCFSSWQYYKNFDYSENICHGCGISEDSTMSKPFCFDCYKELHYR